MIAPITSGGGMKVKIAEAMMYGKIIIGTHEAFEGYDQIPHSYICKTPADFIEAINSIDGYSYNWDVRRCFINKYESSTLINRFVNIII